MKTIDTATLTHSLVIRAEYVDADGNVEQTFNHTAATFSELCGVQARYCTENAYQADTIARVFSRIAIETLTEYPWGSRLRVQTDYNEWLIVSFTRVDESFRKLDQFIV